MPTIDSIDANTLAYQGVPYASSVGSFWWSLHFTWDAVSERERRRRRSLQLRDPGSGAPLDAHTAEIVAPIRSPTMPGGLFAAHREYFFEVRFRALGNWTSAIFEYLIGLFSYIHVNDDGFCL